MLVSFLKSCTWCSTVMLPLRWCVPCLLSSIEFYVHVDFIYFLTKVFLYKRDRGLIDRQHDHVEI
jgi:hypothetical protein